MNLLFSAFLDKLKLAKTIKSFIDYIVFTLRKISIKRRLLLAFILISIFPAIVVAVYSNYNYESSIQSKLSLYSEQVLSEVSKNINNVLSKYETLTEEIIMNDGIQHGLETYKGMGDIEKASFYEELDNKLSSEIYSFNNLKNIHIRFTDGSIFYDLGYEIYSEEETTRILKATEESKENLYFTYTKTPGGTDCIVISRWINSKEDPNKRLGYLMIIVDEKIFAQQIYKNVNMGTGSKIFICDNSGIVISSVSKEVVKGIGLKENGFFERLKDNYENKKYTFTENNGGSKNLIAVSGVNLAKWFLIAEIPFSYINSESVEVRKGVLVVCIIVMTISILLSILIYLSVQIPMKDIVSTAREISAGDLDAAIDDSNNDEVGKLAKNIKFMVEKLKVLIENVKNEQTAKREAELKMLQAQINPHFLFNTLNSLKWTAMLSKNNTLCEGLEALSSLLKDTIINKSEMVTIENELDNLYNYATIQRIRYGSSFSLVYDIEEGLEKSSVLKFILQPIVENSIIHGTDDDEQSEIEIKITVYRLNKKLLIYITDNGKGFDAGNMELHEKKNKLSGIGLSNVDERIKINYGDEYGLEIQSQPGQGTNVKIVLPFIDERKE